MLQHVYFFVCGDANNEEKACISSIDDFVSSVFDERTQRFISRYAFSNELALECGSFLNRHLVIVLGYSGLALLVDHQDKLDHRNY